MIRFSPFSILFLVVAFCACSNSTKLENSYNYAVEKKDIEDEQTQLSQSPTSNKLKDRIPVPPNFKRRNYESNSFGDFLQNLPLKPKGSSVKYFDGSIKAKQGVYVDVVDLPIGDKDLHQCADAIMRLKAEYLWSVKKYDDIKFNFTNGHEVAYSEWMKGKRMEVKGNKTRWVQKTSASNSYQDLWNYLELIFTYAGTSSLEKELQPIAISKAKIGDVLIMGGFPGHAVIIIDEAINTESGNKVFLLAQSYMPAQDLQILLNPNNEKLSPWYDINSEKIVTPEWTFNPKNLKRFSN